ncbi:YitT family protein [Lachnospiraceae bacterium OttesenSCG-928-E19]|nr:YitT family protein [Lachnospiraceae bacterium OttesenSCG-928-E19]
MTKNRLLREYFIITIGTLIISMTVYFFMIPSNAIVGSLSGLAIVLAHFLPFSVSMITFVLNAILLVIGFLFIGKEFGGKTVYTSALLPAFLRVWEIVFPNQESLTGDQLLDVICHVILVSVGLAMLFNANASSGGLDIVAKLLNKYLHIELGRAMTMAGMLTAFCSILIADTKTLVISILGTYCCGFVLDHFIDGFNRRKRVCILTPEYKVIQEFIIRELDRGVTLYPAIGGYKEDEKLELVAILTRNEYAKLLAYLHTIDKRAFVTVSTVNEVVGEWNTSRRR